MRRKQQSSEALAAGERGGAVPRVVLPARSPAERLRGEMYRGGEVSGRFSPRNWLVKRPSEDASGGERSATTSTAATSRTLSSGVEGSRSATPASAVRPRRLQQILRSLSPVRRRPQSPTREAIGDGGGGDGSAAAADDAERGGVPREVRTTPATLFRKGGGPHNESRRGDSSRSPRKSKEEEEPGGGPSGEPSGRQAAAIADGGLQSLFLAERGGGRHGGGEERPRRLRGSTFTRDGAAAVRAASGGAGSGRRTRREVGDAAVALELRLHRLAPEAEENAAELQTAVQSRELRDRAAAAWR